MTLPRRLSLLVSIAVLATLAPLATASAQPGTDEPVYLNEIHYDNASTDVGEFVEVAGPAGTSLTGWDVVLYNGSGGTVYDTDALAGTIPDQGGGFGTVMVSFPSNGIQNGAPDGFALVDAADQLVQFLSYEGSFAAVGGPANGVTSTNIGVAEGGTEPVGQSLQLTGTGTTYDDFTWTGPADDSPGMINGGQASVEPIEIIPIGEVQGSVSDSVDGTQHRSPVAPASGGGASAETVTVQGVVTELTLARSSAGADLNGLFVQNSPATADADPNSSDGIFVFLGSNTTIPFRAGGSYTPAVGDEIVLTGRVSEFFNLTQLSSSLLLEEQEATPGTFTPFEVDPPPDLADANRYYERREGMFGTVPAGSVVLNGRNVFSGTADGEVWVARPDETITAEAGRDPYARRAFRDPHPLDDIPEQRFDNGNGYRILLGSLGIKDAAETNTALIAPARTYDTLTSATSGGLYFSFGKYLFQPDAQIALTPGPDPSANNPVQEQRADEWAAADYNVENLYDFRDDPNDGCDFAGNGGCPGVRPPFNYVPASEADYQEHLKGIAQQIVEDLLAPDVIAVQEAEDQDICSVSGGALACGAADDADGKPDTLQELTLAISDAGGPPYDAAFDRDGADDRGIVSAFLYRTDTTELLAADVGDPVLGSGPDVQYRGTAVASNTDVSNPKTLNADLPDDVDTTTGTDGSLVYTRAPQVGRFRVSAEAAAAEAAGTGPSEVVTVISNHFSSVPDRRVGQRTEQAAYNAAIVDAIRAADPGAKVLAGGDFNVYPRPDDPFAPGQPVGTAGDLGPSDQLAPLYDEGLTNLVDTMLAQEPEAAFSYVFQGQTQTLDQQFVTPSLFDDLVQARVAHVNADYPAEFDGDGARGVSDHDPQVARFAIPANGGGQAPAQPTIDAPETITASNENEYEVSGDAERGSTVEVELADEAGGTETGTATAGDGGRYAVVLDASDLAPGTVTITVTASNGDGTSPAAVKQIVKLYRLTLLHDNDAESRLLPTSRIGGVARFTTLVDEQKARAAQETDGHVLVSAGDMILPGPELQASIEGGVFYDALALSRLGHDGLTVGNHEFDFGPEFLADYIEAYENDETFVSANLDLSGEPSLAQLEAEGRLADSVVTTVGGRRVGVVGATTEELPAVSSPGEVTAGDVDSAIQDEVDDLTKAGVDLIVVSSHLQTISEERQLARTLRDVDLIVAGGGSELLANAGDPLLPGPSPVLPYPVIETNTAGRPVPVVTTEGDYGYLGRLVVDFDADGMLVGVDDPASLPLRNSAAGVADARQPDQGVQDEVEEPVAAFVARLDEEVIALSEVDLDGLRANVRSRETNLGNLLADALRTVAADRAAEFGAAVPDVGLQNGGGIRNTVLIPVGEVTPLDTFNTAPFSNFVSVVEDIPPSQFKELLENAVSRVEFGDGRFAQVSGFSFTYDPNSQSQTVTNDGIVTRPGLRVRDVTLDDGTQIVIDGAVNPTARNVNIATNDFSARGGDQYPFRGADFTTVGVTYQQALQAHIENLPPGTLEDQGPLPLITCADYPEGGERRIVAEGQAPPADTCPPAPPTIDDADDIDETNDDAYPVSGDSEEGSTVTVVATDENGLAETGTVVANSPYEVELDVSSLDDGAVVVTASATDAAGNVSQPTAVTVTKDTEVTDGPPDDDGSDPPVDDGSDPPVDDGSDPPVDDGSDPPVDDASDPPVDDGSDPPVDDNDDGPSVAPVTRIAGTGRTETALEISQATFEDGGADAVVLSRADIFPDALAGTPLAITQNAPLLLTANDALEPAVAAEVQRVMGAGGTIYLLGGTAALSEAVEDQAVALGFPVTRYGGANRFATATLIATEGLGDPATLLLADGGNFPDAVSAGAAAGEASGAVLLTSEELPPETRAYLDQHAAATLFAIGGPAARAVPTATPVFGDTRIETAVLVAEEFFDAPTVVGLATSEAFPDALTGGAAVGALGGPLLLNGQSLDPVVRDYLSARADTLQDALIFGGTDRLPQSVADEVEAIID